MCIVSNIGDQYKEDFFKKYPDWVHPGTFPSQLPDSVLVSRKEFEDLKKEVEALKELLKAAKKYDEATGQPECEVDEKVALIKHLASLLGVDMSEIFT